MWETIGDFSEKYTSHDPNVGLMHSIEYVITDNTNQQARISKVTLLQAKDSSFRFSLKFTRQAAKKDFKLSGIDQKLIDSGPGPRKTLFTNPTRNKRNLFNILNGMIAFDPHILLIIEDIGKKIGLEVVPGLAIESLLTLPIAVAIDEVKKAQPYSPHLIWELAQAYLQDSLLPKPAYQVDSQTIYDLLSAISPENSCYATAQDAIVDLLMRVDSCDDKQFDLQLKFSHAINGTRQSVTDKLFEQMCGYTMRQSPFSNIKPDVDTLCLLAGEIKRLNDALKAQQLAQVSANPQSLFYSQAEQATMALPQKGIKKIRK